MVVSQTLGTHDKEIKEKGFFLLDLLFMNMERCTNQILWLSAIYQLTLPCNLAKQCLLLERHLIPYERVKGSNLRLTHVLFFLLNSTCHLPE